MVNLDVLVIGGGTSGEYAARAARENVDSVGIIEKVRTGGDCVFHACIPTKAMVQAARMYKAMRTASFYGLPELDKVADFKNVKDFKDRIISGIAEGRDERVQASGLRLFKGTGRFISPHEVAGNNEIIKADKIVIACGSEPAVPPIPGLKEATYITNIEALELDRVPERLAIIGGGPIGVEFAQIFNAFGAKVRIYEVLDRLLINEDEEISLALAGYFDKQGISVSTSTTVSCVVPGRQGKLIIAKTRAGEEKKEEYDEILLATGRKPAIDNLGLDACGVEYNRKGITVDAFLRTNVAHIWAAGDVTGTHLFTYVAWEQGQIAGMNATSSPPKSLDYRVLPRATFCDPEIASVGLTEAQAKEQGYHVRIGKFDYADLTRPMVSDQNDGFIKIVAEDGSGRILGGHIVGAEASILIHEVAVAMAGNLTAADIGNTFHSYPTLSEGVRYACQAII